MQKEQAIALIKWKIIDEQRNKPNLDWQEIAARKIYSALFEEKEKPKRKGVWGQDLDACDDFFDRIVKDAGPRD